jgi:hypothetical protein
MKFYLMKSTIVLLLMGGILSIPGYAQTFLGLKGGLTASRITYQLDAGASYLEYMPRLAPHFGLMAEFQLSDRLYLQPELLYAEKGARGRSLLPEEGPHFTERFQTIALPLLLSVRLGDHLSLAAGPELGYLLRSRLEVDTDGPGNLTGGSYFDDQRFLLNVDLEVGYRIERFQLSLRGILGWRPVAEIEFTDVNGVVTDLVKYHNHALQLSLAYRLFGN